jgi:hypothetical protein
MSKYRAIRTNGYASKREAEYAANLWALARAGKIVNLSEQVSFELLPATKDFPRPLRYVADFLYFDKESIRHVVDVKGMRTPVYKLKKRLMKQLLGVEIEEV